MKYTARTDFDIANTPTLPIGQANSSIVDPDFGTTIIRATDALTVGRNASLSVGSAGFCSVWNTNSTAFWLNTSGGANYVTLFDPVALKVGAVLGLPAGPLCWSKVSPATIYSVVKGVLVAYVLEPDLSSYSLEVLYDFKTAIGAVRWNSLFTVSQDDSTFAVGFSTTGGQGSGVYACAWTRDRGVRVLNTSTGQVTGDWGPLGTIDNPDRYLLHEVSASKLGDYIILGKSLGTTTAGDANASNYFWQHQTLHVQPIGDAGTAAGGHPAPGYTQWMNPGTPYEGADLRYYSDVSKYRVVVGTVPKITPPLDAHASWHNGDTLDSQPFCQITTNAPVPPGPYSFAWVNEILLFDPVTGLVHREGHTFCSNQSPYFAAQYGVGSISQDGRFVIWCSDWMGTLGLDVFGKSRSDVFICVLR